MSKNNKLITAADMYDVLDAPFKTEKERIKYMSKAYKNMSIAKAFSVFYNIELSQETKANKSINTINVIEVGNVYTGTVKTFSKCEITFDVPGVKEDVTEIILALKELSATIDGEGSRTLKIEAQGPCTIKGSDIICPPDVEILSKDLHIATLDENSKFNMEIMVDNIKV